MDGKPIHCLLVTGSEVTLIPRYVAQEQLKTPVTSQIRVANGTPIEVLGLVQLPVLLKGQKIFVEGVASDNVAQMLLGIDWLEEQTAIWDMKRGELFTHGRVFALKPKMDVGWNRRVVIQKSVQLLAKSETN